MLYNPLKVHVPSKLEADFVSRAKRAFPKEVLAYLIGHADENHTLDVKEIMYPADVDLHTTRDAVDVQWRWVREARRRAKAINGMVVGDIHSHPYTATELHGRRPDCSPSENDLTRAKPGEIQGICTISQGKDGRLRARVRYWGIIRPAMEVVK